VIWCRCEVGHQLHRRLPMNICIHNIPLNIHLLLFSIAKINYRLHIPVVLLFSPFLIWLVDLDGSSMRRLLLPRPCGSNINVLPAFGFFGIDITALNYHRLIVYQYGCGVATREVGESLAWLESSSTICKCGCVPTWKVATTSEARILTVVQSKSPLLESRESLRGLMDISVRVWMSYIQDLASRQYGNRHLDCSDCKITVMNSMNQFRTLYIDQANKLELIAMVSSVTPYVNSLLL